MKPEAFFLRVLNLRKGELCAALLSFLMFTLIFCSYAVLRPLRETMGIAGGVKNLQWLFAATFIVSFLVQLPYAKAVSKYSRRLILPLVFGFFALNLILFALAFRAGFYPVWTGRVFFVWLSVYNLLVISLGWSLLNDLLGGAESRRLFAIAAGGSSFGSVIGPVLTAALVKSLGESVLFIISALMLLSAAVLSQVMFRWRAAHPADGSTQVTGSAQSALKGSVIAGLTASVKSKYLRHISLFILLSSMVNTFLYFELMTYVAIEYPERNDQTVVFALIDLIVNAATLTLQLLVTGRIAESFGLKPLLLSVPLFAALGFTVLIAFPSFFVIAAAMALRRICEYALVRPGREMLFNPVSPEDKYKAKNFIDTVVYRFGDLVSAFASRGLAALGGGTASALGGAVAALLWAANARYLCLLHQRQTEKAEA